MHEWGVANVSVEMKINPSVLTQRDSAGTGAQDKAISQNIERADQATVTNLEYDPRTQTSSLELNLSQGGKNDVTIKYSDDKWLATSAVSSVADARGVASHTRPVTPAEMAQVSKLLKATSDNENAGAVKNTYLALAEFFSKTKNGKLPELTQADVSQLLDKAETRWISKLAKPRAAPVADPAVSQALGSQTLTYSLQTALAILAPRTAPLNGPEKATYGNQIGQGLNQGVDAALVNKVKEHYVRLGGDAKYYAFTPVKQAAEQHLKATVQGPPAPPLLPKPPITNPIAAQIQNTIDRWAVDPSSINSVPKSLLQASVDAATFKSLFKTQSKSKVELNESQRRLVTSMENAVAELSKMPRAKYTPVLRATVEEILIRGSKELTGPALSSRNVKQAIEGLKGQHIRLGGDIAMLTGNLSADQRQLARSLTTALEKLTTLNPEAYSPKMIKDTEKLIARGEKELKGVGVAQSIKDTLNLVTGLHLKLRTQAGAPAAAAPAHDERYEKALESIAGKNARKNFERTDNFPAYEKNLLTEPTPPKDGLAPEMREMQRRLGGK